jgi:hypothetical protein
MARAKAAGMKAALMAGFVMVAVACGGKAKPDSTAAGQGGDKHEVGQTCAMGPDCQMGQMSEMGGKGEMGEMAGMPPQIAKFHETLAPRWHAPQGPQRMADTCAVIAQLHTEAEAVAAAPLPNGADAAAWSASGKQLTEAVTALDAPCKAKDAAAFEPAFAQVHKSFHHAMEAASAHGPEHGEHEHQH